VLKKYVAFREWRFAARQAFLLLTLLMTMLLPPFRSLVTVTFSTPTRFIDNRIGSEGAASGHFEIGHTLWFRVVLKASE
jgi:hypothetical protein